jgi:hypothetical protein
MLATQVLAYPLASERDPRVEGLGVFSLAGLNALHEECAKLVLPSRLANRGRLVWISAENVLILDGYHLTAILLYQLILVVQVVLELALQWTVHATHSGCDRGDHG